MEGLGVSGKDFLPQPIRSLGSGNLSNFGECSFSVFRGQELATRISSATQSESWIRGLIKLRYCGEFPVSVHRVRSNRQGFLLTAVSKSWMRRSLKNCHNCEEFGFNVLSQESAARISSTARLGDLDQETSQISPLRGLSFSNM